MQLSSISRAYHGSLKGPTPLQCHISLLCMWFLSAVKIPPQSPGRWWFFCYWAAPWWWGNELPIDVYGGSGARFLSDGLIFAQRNWWFYPQIRSDAAFVKERPEKKKCRNAHESVKPLPDVILTSVKVLSGVFLIFFGIPKKTGWGWESVLLVNRALAGHTKLGLGSVSWESKGPRPPTMPRFLTGLFLWANYSDRARQLVVIVRESTLPTALRLVVVWEILFFLPQTSGKWSTLTTSQLGLFSLNRQNQFTCPHVKEVAITCLKKMHIGMGSFRAEMPPYSQRNPGCLRYPKFAHIFEDLKKISCAIQHSCQEIPQSVQDFEPVPPVVEP